ncbi:DsbE family thiol:disulfide interchange protein [Roseovarius faecimaris]|uniref:DsbE family thiol:disulfide interchange protein n=1 Tax=Roseovarius faecimaris TaxID=2494550 RepID=A0A6I6ITU8_9RHOB|nr:DsbE family thiol:disulfide interchange protein [Roseovarius faecimaris]QGX98756.1 DsbE family thiol:disulfide interchange protein [Roseovarius faecimaris]
MAKPSPLMLAPPLVFFALAMLFFVGMQRENPDELPSALEGKPAPAVEVTALGDAPVFEDAMLRGEGVKLVNFWASWCAPCRVEHPNLELMAKEGITIYGVNYKDDPAKAQRFLRELGDPYAALGADASGRMALNWGLYGVPETYVIDGNGQIVLRFAGPITPSILESTIRPAIAEAQAN